MRKSRNQKSYIFLMESSKNDKLLVFIYTSTWFVIAKQKRFWAYNTGKISTLCAFLYVSLVFCVPGGPG